MAPSRPHKEKTHFRLEILFSFYNIFRIRKYILEFELFIEN